MDARATLGTVGEAAAERWYVGRGYRVIARNWRCRLGELDLVLARGSTLVVCEVKARRGFRYGGGWQAVDTRKRAKLRAVAEAFLAGSRVEVAAVRFDVASVALAPDGSARVEVFQDAF